MEKFKLVSQYSPMGDQPTAIKQLVEGIRTGKKEQVLLGGTGTGKTFTVSNVIAQVNKPTLVLAHNKTLAGQLYSELKEFFPENRVEYFVSNFDFYQPEAYIPKSDTYIDKNAKTNYEIEMLRSAAMNSLLERRDTIVVASVASIYGLGNPEQYREMIFSLRVGQEIDRRELLTYLVDRQYQRNDIEQSKGTFRVRGDVIEIVPGHTESWLIRIELFGDEVEGISEVDPLTGKVLGRYKTYTIYPAYGYVTKKEQMLRACDTISEELKERLQYFKDAMKPLEYERLDQRTRHDIEMLREVGMCPGIENYSRHIDGRLAGQRPYTLIDYFPDDFLMIIDESHVMLPQVRGMFNGDRSRKETLVEYGFRLPSALDNRPLRFEEFEDIIHQVIYVSATPGDYELEKTHGEYAEQIIRPTGLLDPIIDVRPTKNQIDDLIDEIHERIEKNERVLITTLTKRMAEDLSAYLKEVGLKVAYLHSDTKTLERTEILRDLRLGKYDVLVGINLLREGLDLPEVSLVCILDADKEGFLRSERSLIQTIGRAARNANGKVIMYGDHITESMQKAIDETNRRRQIQEAYNKEHHIIPQTIHKEIHDLIQGKETMEEASSLLQKGKKATKQAKKKLIDDLEKEVILGRDNTALKEEVASVYRERQKEQEEVEILEEDEIESNKIEETKNEEAVSQEILEEQIETKEEAKEEIAEIEEIKAEDIEKVQDIETQEKQDEIEESEDTVENQIDDEVEEEEEKPKKVSLFDRLKQGLTKAKQGITDRIDEVLKAYTKVDEELLEDLEEVLITADVGVNTTMDIIEKLEDVIRTKKITDPQDVREELKLIIEDILSKDDTKLDVSHSPTIILMVGVNGVGKTTTIGKLAHRYKSEGKKVLLAAGDTFRAAAIDQLEVWANRCNVDIIKHQEGADPGAVIFDAIKASKARGVDVLICDTAGRLHNKSNLMNELGKVFKIVDREYPEAKKEVLLVVDATTGQNAVSQAKSFKEVCDITGLALTKLDGTAKGGVILAVKSEVDVPVKLIGVGEKMEDLQDFDSKSFVDALFS